MTWIKTEQPGGQRGWWRCEKGIWASLWGTHSKQGPYTLQLPWGGAFRAEETTGAEAGDLNELGVSEEQQAAPRLQGAWQGWERVGMRWEKGRASNKPRWWRLWVSPKWDGKLSNPDLPHHLPSPHWHSGCWVLLETISQVRATANPVSIPNTSPAQTLHRAKLLRACDTSLLPSYVSPTGPATSFASPS